MTKRQENIQLGDVFWMTIIVSAFWASWLHYNMPRIQLFDNNFKLKNCNECTFYVFVKSEFAFNSAKHEHIHHFYTKYKMMHGYFLMIENDEARCKMFICRLIHHFT